jgi:hypothetical protein
VQVRAPARPTAPSHAPIDLAGLDVEDAWRAEAREALSIARDARRVT